MERTTKTEFTSFQFVSNDKNGGRDGEHDRPLSRGGGGAQGSEKCDDQQVRDRGERCRETDQQRRQSTPKVGQDRRQGVGKSGRNQRCLSRSDSRRGNRNVHHGRVRWCGLRCAVAKISRWKGRRQQHV